ncbi:hypothetical protein HNQ60_000242 [Povalibacter uvarum]|uniref:Uncharacterized protein n=1 Tax=Povalibacter uvarum TaxID=732238 RepID=A0A841HF59_9GAMM|nr:hypothetical protein [Povalibacter uvarum]
MAATERREEFHTEVTEITELAKAERRMLGRDLPRAIWGL